VSTCSTARTLGIGAASTWGSRSILLVESGNTTAVAKKAGPGGPAEEDPGKHGGKLEGGGGPRGSEVRMKGAGRGFCQCACLAIGRGLSLGQGGRALQISGLGDV
jgi:hypothetical protein